MANPARRHGVRSLTHFSVCCSGRHVEIGFTDDAGEPAALQLPQECLGTLLMTLPRMIEMALRRRSGNADLKQVYPLGDWQLHAGDEPESMILSLSTPDGFRVSFCAPIRQATELGEALTRLEHADFAGQQHPIRH
jgi:hypothetical protein